MKKKKVSAILLALLLIGILIYAFNFQPLKASETIHIRADGSVDPPTANITSVDNVTYTFTSNIIGCSIVVERDNIVVDGAGYTLQGTGTEDSKGIYLYQRRNVTIKNMEIKAFGVGIDFYGDQPHACSITGNNITANNWGIYLFGSDHSITGNNITNSNYYGVYLYLGSNNTVSGNNITNNQGGVYIDFSSNNVLRNNSMAGNKRSFLVLGEELSHFAHDVDLSNTVDGKPIYYWINRQNMEVPSDAGYVALVNSTDITVNGLELKNNGQGILLAYTNNSTIIDNNIKANIWGVYLWYSNNNTVSGSNIINNHRGVYLWYSSNNNFYHNNFINNTQQVYIYPPGSTNIWDDGYPSGGNYWSDYTGVDLYSGPDQDQLGGDGIGDTSYIINSGNIDHYPLISPFPQATDFDIVVIPSTDITIQGTTVTTNVYVSAIAGYDYLVSLSASGQPEGVTIDFNPDTGTPGFTSTMTVQIGGSVPPNTYPITVTGLGSDGKTHSATYTLTVTTGPGPVPEFPLGTEAATAIGLMIAIVYVWMRRRSLKTSDTAKT